MINAFLFLWITNWVSPPEPNFVVEFHTLENKQDEERFIELYKDSSIDASAYIIALQMKKAEYTILPWRKWTIFHSQKKRLDQLIISHPQNVHFRYIRLVLQEHSPAFLGYNVHIEEDKNFLLNKMEQTDSTDYMDTYIKQHTSL